MGPAATAAADVPTHGILLPNGDVTVFLPGWAGRGRETVAWGGRGRRYTARVGELVVLVEAAMARESESPPSAAAAVGGDASGGEGGRPKKAKAR